MIPKRIFYVWGANEPKRVDVELCIKTWKYAMPDYEIVEINEDSTEYFNFRQELENNEWFRTVYERKMYAYVSDYIRIKTLYDNGGIYIDTDVTTIKSFNEFLNEPAFVGIQDSSADGGADIVEPAVLGSTRGNEFIGDVLKFYDKSSLHNIWNTPIFIMPQILQYVLENTYEKQAYPAKNKQTIIRYNNISIFPEEYFIPFRCTEKFTPRCITKNTHSVHWFGGSWVKPEVLYFLENKHRIPLEEIDESFIKYQKTEKASIKIQLIKNTKL